jgi:predicted methyltransferase
MNEKARIKNKNPNSLAKARERQRKWAASNPEKAFITMQNARLAKYGIDLAKRSEMSINQDHKCKICGKPEDLQTKKMAVDHCHETGKVRGLLCDPCNRGLGLFYDNPETLLKAANYILNFQEIEDATPSGMPQQTV